MKALLLAAGRGTRLGELTEHTPKPMAKVGGRHVLEHNLRWLLAHGIREVAINTHHLGDVIEDRFGDGAALGLGAAACVTAACTVAEVACVKEKPTADDFEHVDLWYDTANWLPVGVAMLDEQGNTRRLRLSDAKVNPELDDDQRRRLAGTVPTTADWVVDERRCPDGVEPREGGE